MRLLLIRHGQTQANVDGILEASVPGPGLDELGRQQADALPDAVAGEAIGGIWVSTMIRTQETAAPLAARLRLEPTILPGLREIGAGSLQGRADWDAVNQYLEVVFAWMQRDLAVRMPDGESGEQFLARYDDAIAEVVRAGVPTAAVVSHAAAIRTWTALRVSNVDATTPEYYRLDNTGVVVVDGDAAGGWRLRSWSGRPVGGEHLTDRAAEDPTGAGPR